MIFGKNEITLNGVTLCKAVEEYVNRRLTNGDDHIAIADVAVYSGNPRAFHFTAEPKRGPASAVKSK